MSDQFRAVYKGPGVWRENPPSHFAVRSLACIVCARAFYLRTFIQQPQCVCLSWLVCVFVSVTPSCFCVLLPGSLPHSFFLFHFIHCIVNFLPFILVGLMGY